MSWQASGVGRGLRHGYAAQREPQVVDPVLGTLAALGSTGPVREFAVGTGRVALPLPSRGLDVHIIELSPHMAEQLRNNPGGHALAVSIGDMTTTRLPATSRWSTCWRTPS